MIEPLVVTREFPLKWSLGLRTAMLINRVAARYSSSIELRWKRDRADAKDLVSLVCLGASAGPALGDVVSLSASGVDADAALVALADLFSSGERVSRCAHPGCAAAPILTDLTPRALEYSCSQLHFWTVDRSTGRSILS